MISAETKMNADMVYQLDLFYIHQKSNSKIKDENTRKEVKKLIKANKYDELILKIKGLLNGNLLKNII